MLAINKIDALMAGVTKADIANMPPAQRQRLAAVLRYIADLADPPPKPHVTDDANERTLGQQTSGVLADLRNGHRVE